MEFPWCLGRSTYKSAKAALSATHASQAENVPEYSHSNRSHPQSVDGTEVTNKFNSILIIHNFNYNYYY